MKILFVSSEALPFASSGGLGEVAGSLPQALRRRLVGCRVVMPLYDTIAKEHRDKMKFLTSLSVPVAWRRQYCGVLTLTVEGVVYYFIDNQYYFKRGALYGHYDDAERFAFFARAVLEMLPCIEFQPDIIHCNDWQSALTPAFFQLFYGSQPFYQNMKTIFTIHNIQYQGKYGPEILEDVLGIPKQQGALVEYDKCINFMKGGIECAHQVTTVSPTYAREILDPYYSHGLDFILRQRRDKLSGILNGIDIKTYNPQDDPDLLAPFTADDLSGKAQNKAALQREMGLPQAPQVPLMAMVTRLVSHKGLDLVQAILEELLRSQDLQMVLLGSGDWKYEEFFKTMAARFPGKFALRLGFLPPLAHKIYGGADLFLMPSKSEPCGLSQMMALRYGTIPIVRETGGLKDTVTDSGNLEGNGFTFSDFDAGSLRHAIQRALDGYRQREGWEILVRRAMACDYSWGRSANTYFRLYKSLISTNGSTPEEAPAEPGDAPPPAKPAVPVSGATEPTTPPAKLPPVTPTPPAAPKPDKPKKAGI